MKYLKTIFDAVNSVFCSQYNHHDKLLKDKQSYFNISYFKKSDLNKALERFPINWCDIAILSLSYPHYRCLKESVANILLFIYLINSKVQVGLSEIKYQSPKHAYYDLNLKYRDESIKIEIHDGYIRYSTEFESIDQNLFLNTHIKKHDINSFVHIREQLDSCASDNRANSAPNINQIPRANSAPNLNPINKIRSISSLSLMGSMYDKSEHNDWQEVYFEMYGDKIFKDLKSFYEKIYSKSSKWYSNSLHSNRKGKCLEAVISYYAKVLSNRDKANVPSISKMVEIHQRVLTILPFQRSQNVVRNSLENMKITKSAKAIFDYDITPEPSKKYSFEYLDSRLSLDWIREARYGRIDYYSSLKEEIYNYNDHTFLNIAIACEDRGHRQQFYNYVHIALRLNYINN